MNIIGIKQKNEKNTIVLVAFKPGIRTLSYYCEQRDEKTLYPINFPWLYFKIFLKTPFSINYFISYASKEPHKILDNNHIQLETAQLNFPNLILRNNGEFTPCMGPFYEKPPSNFSLYDQIKHYFDHYLTSEFTGNPVIFINQKYYRFWELNEQFPFHQIKFSEPSICYFDHVGNDAENFAKGIS